MNKMPWRERAACAEPGVDRTDFYPEGTTEERTEQEMRAKGICAQCLVQPECYEYGISNREIYGVWGGSTEKERDRIFKDTV